MNVNCSSSASPYVRIVHNYLTDMDSRTKTIWSVDHALHYFKDGEGDYFIENQHYPIRPGSAFLIRPFVPFSFNSRSGTRFHMYNIHFDWVEQEDSRSITWPYPHTTGALRKEVAARIAEEGEFGIPSNIVFVERESFEQIFLRLSFLKGQQLPGTSLLMKAAMLEVIALLLNQTHAQDRTMPTAKSQGIAAAVTYMQNHLSQTITLQDLADAAIMSPSYLLKQFQKHYGCSPMRYRNRVRMEQAKWELLHSNKDIKLIAAETGFESLHAFYHAFRRECSMSPGSYRTSYRFPER